MVVDPIQHLLLCCLIKYSIQDHLVKKYIEISKYKIASSIFMYSQLHLPAISVEFVVFGCNFL